MKNPEHTPASIRLEELESRMATARTWKARISTLLRKRRRKNPSYSEAQFCRDHDLDYGFFNRLKNVQVAPTKKTVDAIEAALSAEGV